MSSLLEKLIPEDVFGSICSYIQFDETLVALFATSKEIRRMLIARAPDIPIPRGLLGNIMMDPVQRDSRLIRALGLVYMDQNQLEGPINHEPGATRIVIEGQAPMSLSWPLEFVDLTKITVLRLDTVYGGVEDFGSQVVTLPNLKVLGITGDMELHEDILKRLEKLTDLIVTEYNNNFTLPDKLCKLTLSMKKFIPIALPKRLIELNLKIIGRQDGDHPVNPEDYELVIPNSRLKTLRLDFHRGNPCVPKSIQLTHPSILTGVYLSETGYYETLFDSSPLLEVINYSPRVLLTWDEFTRFMVFLKGMCKLHTFIIEHTFTRAPKAEDFVRCFVGLGALRLLGLQRSAMGVYRHEAGGVMFSELNEILDSRVQMKIGKFFSDGGLDHIAHRVIHIAGGQWLDITIDYSAFTRIQELSLDVGDSHGLVVDTLKLPPNLKKLSVYVRDVYDSEVDESEVDESEVDESEVDEYVSFVKGVLDNHPGIQEVVIRSIGRMNPNDMGGIRHRLNPFYVNISETRIKCTRTRWCFVQRQGIDRRLEYI